MMAAHKLGYLKDTTPSVSVPNEGCTIEPSISVANALFFVEMYLDYNQ